MGGGSAVVWASVGYHAAAMLLTAGLLDGADAATVGACADYILGHLDKVGGGVGR